MSDRHLAAVLIADAVGFSVRVAADEAIALRADRASERAPSYGKALALRAWCNTIRSSWSGETERDVSVPEGVAVAGRALDVAPGDPEVQAYAGYTLGFMGQELSNALGLRERAVEWCPSFGWAWVSIAMLEAMRRDPRRALDACLHAERLNPRDTMAFRLESARDVAHWALEDWARVLKHAHLALASAPDLTYVRALVVVAHAELGQMEEARAARATLNERFPDFHIGYHSDRLERFEGLCGKPLEAWRERLTEPGLPE